MAGLEGGEGGGEEIGEKKGKKGPSARRMETEGATIEGDGSQTGLKKEDEEK